MKWTDEYLDWLLRNLNDLKQGLHVEPPESVVLGITHRGLKRANFENPCIAIAELESRIEECGIDGTMLYLYSGLGQTERYIGQSLGFHVQRVERGIYKAREYIKNRGKIKRSYSEYKNERKEGSLSHRCSKCKKPSEILYKRRGMVLCEECLKYAIKQGWIDK